jgi:hypothetical protein
LSDFADNSQDKHRDCNKRKPKHPLLLSGKRAAEHKKAETHKLQLKNPDDYSKHAFHP